MSAVKSACVAFARPPLRLLARHSTALVVKQNQEMRQNNGPLGATKRQNRKEKKRKDLRSLRMTEGSLKCAAAFSEIAECMYSFGSTAVYVWQHTSRSVRKRCYVRMGR
eukprot:1740452-Rhodomonas_salina.1